MVEVKEECYGVGDESRCRVTKVAYRPRSDEAMTGGAGLGKKVERQLKGESSSEIASRQRCVNGQGEESLTGLCLNTHALPHG